MHLIIIQLLSREIYVRKHHLLPSFRRFPTDFMEVLLKMLLFEASDRILADLRKKTLRRNGSQITTREVAPSLISRRKIVNIRAV